MEEIYELGFNDFVFDVDLSRLDPSVRRRILNTIESKLEIAPMHFGKPLRYTLKNLRSLRVGDYRVLYQVKRRKVFIGAVFHRSAEYEEWEHRFTSNL